MISCRFQQKLIFYNKFCVLLIGELSFGRLEKERQTRVPHLCRSWLFFILLEQCYAFTVSITKLPLFVLV